jgi:hypothetical protein
MISFFIKDIYYVFTPYLTSAKNFLKKSSENKSDQLAILRESYSRLLVGRQIFNWPSFLLLTTVKKIKRLLTKGNTLSMRSITEREDIVRQIGSEYFG